MNIKEKITLSVGVLVSLIVALVALSVISFSNNWTCVIPKSIACVP